MRRWTPDVLEYRKGEQELCGCSGHIWNSQKQNY